jgi:hypothetical protein
MSSYLTEPMFFRVKRSGPFSLITSAVAPPPLTLFKNPHGVVPSVNTKFPLAYPRCAAMSPPSVRSAGRDQAPSLNSIRSQ